MSKEIKHISGAAGGYLVGNSHKNGGIQAINKAIGKPLEMEGGEVVITKPAVEDNELREFEGEMLTNRQILSKINESGGGISFAEKGAELPTQIEFCGTEYKYGGETLTDYQIAHRISKCGCNHDEEKFAYGGEILFRQNEYKNPIITFDNFHINTFTNFSQIKSNEIPNREPNFISNSGSKYWYIEETQEVIRQSNHWGRTIASCNWLLDGMSVKKQTQGISKLSDFHREFLNLLNPDNIGKEFEICKTSLAYKGNGKMDIEILKGKYVKSTSSFYIFDNFKVANQTIAYVKPLFEIYDKGGKLEKSDLYQEWEKLVNMSATGLQLYYDSSEGKDSGLSASEAKEQGIKSGRESARWIIKMKKTNVDNWTPQMWEWAKRQVSFIKRMTGVPGELYDENGTKTRKHKALLIWGHDPEKYEQGGNLEKELKDNAINVAVNATEALPVMEKGGNVEKRTTAIKTTSLKHYKELLAKGVKAELVTKQDLNKFEKGGETSFNEITELVISPDNNLSQQLVALTGDYWNAHDFANIDESITILSFMKPFYHKETGKKFVVIDPNMQPKKETIKPKESDQQFTYMMLSRLKSDNDYFLGYGNRHEKHLWADNVKDQIAEMKRLWNSLEIKPEWLSMEDILNYEKQMTDSQNNLISTETKTYQISDYKNPYEVNRAIEKLIDSKENDFTPNEIEFISHYSGYGGLEKQGSFSDEELKGLLYEYFTPDAVVKKMWALAYKYGFGTFSNPHIMEPSVGTGNFFKYAPTEAELFGNEINNYSKRVCEILYPKAMITLQPFEKNFISKNNSIKNKLNDVHKYHLVIGNPPYGRAVSKYLAMGESDYTKATSFTEYFITRGLDLLHPGGLLIFVVGAEQYNGGTLFLDSGISVVKKNIFDKAQLVDAYRLPTKIFERTGVASEILVFKKK